MISLSLDTPIAELSAQAKRCAKKMATLGLHTCRDVLWHIPARFEDFSRVVPIGELAAGSAVTVQGKILLISNRRSFRRRMIVTEGLVGDETGAVKVLWFNQPFLIKNLQVGDRVSLSGKTSDNFLDLQLVNPGYEKLKADRDGIHTGRLVPIYRTTEGLSQKQLRAVIAEALSRCGGEVEEWIPDDIAEAEDLPPLLSALSSVHFPGSEAEFTHALRRFQFEELLLLQIMTAQARRSMQAVVAHAIPEETEAMRVVMESLPFSLTEGQRVALWEIVKDLSRPSPMNRLLEGDVGAGKTIVAALAAVHVVRHGGQVAIMAPTELLARQHFTSITRTLQSTGIGIALCTAAQWATWGWESGVQDEKKMTKKKEREQISAGIATGEIGIVIGTHSLIQDSLAFQQLTLVVVDEQHRFGVGQRKALREKGGAAMPHLLSMTATPIPRSLTLTLYGDLDVSLLTDKPKGRQAIITKVVPANYRDWTYDFIRKQVAEGGAAFVICPLIDPSDAVAMKAASEEHGRLAKVIFPDLRVAMIHGKMKAPERTVVLQAMMERSVDVLVATSVVEVGIDIPHATVMLIEGAERFGLAQLHQFRGRVGRGSAQSYCFLMPEDEEKGNNARLQALVACDDGFALAEEDLKLRGPGEVYGLRQSGELALKLADITDIIMVKKARDWAARYVDVLDEYPALAVHVHSMARAVHLE